MHRHGQVIDQDWQRPVAKHPTVASSHQMFGVGDHIVKSFESQISTTLHRFGIHWHAGFSVAVEIRN
jgi:hypothetical protein